MRLTHILNPRPSSRRDKLQRWFNKKLGRPATADVGVLAGMLATLKAATTKFLGQPIDHLATTYPSISALTTEDMNDALEYAGLRSWLGDSIYYPKHVAESRAVLAGNGHGLCATHTDLFQCWDEGNGFPIEITLFVSFTRHALYASLDRIGAAIPPFTKDRPIAPRLQSRSG